MRFGESTLGMFSPIRGYGWQEPHNVTLELETGNSAMGPRTYPGSTTPYTYRGSSAPYTYPGSSAPYTYRGSTP